MAAIQQLGYVVPLNLAVALNASSPDPGGTAAKGASLWSTTTGTRLVWNGTNWVSG